MNGAAHTQGPSDARTGREIHHPMFPNSTSIRLVGNFDEKRTFELAVVRLLHPEQRAEDVTAEDRETLVHQAIRRGQIAYVRDQFGYHLWDLRVSLGGRR